MTILIEAISIVVRCDALERLGPDGQDHFYSSIPNQTYCSDGRLARVGFMEEKDALDFVAVMESLGLVRLEADAPADFMIALQGVTDSVPCKWLERFKVECRGNTLDVAAFVDDEGKVYLEEDPGGFVAPSGWSPEDLVHQSQDNLRYLRSRHSDGGGMLDHYRSPDGQVVYIGRQKRWFDLPFLCLMRMPLRFCVMTSALGALYGTIVIKGGSGGIKGAFLGGLLGLVICSQFAREFPMTPLWIKRLLGG